MLQRLNQPDLAKLVLRFTFGGLILLHGWPKIQKLINAPRPIDWADPIGLGPGPSLFLAASAEFVAALFIIAGLWTRWMTLPLIVTMLVIAFIVHWPDPISDKESALLYLGGYLAILLLGAGKYSIDHWLSARKRT